MGLSRQPHHHSAQHNFRDRSRLLRLWTTLASLSQSRVCHASAVVKGKLYVIGGEFLDCASTSTNQMEVYSPASNSWARGADVPVAINQSVAVAL